MLGAMLVIRRLVDRHRAYTGMFLPGEPPRIFPTSDMEHARILQIYLQDKAYEGVHNDFSAMGLNQPEPSARTAPKSPVVAKRQRARAK